VLALGRPEPRKGFETFVSTATALAETHSAVRWLWIGAGSPGRKGPVELLPWMPEAGSCLRSATLLLVPSTAEGIPLVVMEALACGCPVVASRVGGIPEAIEDGVNGVLLEPEDTAGWVRAVDALLRDPYRRAALGAAGRAAWEAHWTAEAMASRFEALLAEVVEARR
jgi:glycosyltransferase involved in cell wall biosynthesis